MTLSEDQWKQIAAGGSAHVQHADGTAVTYGTRVRVDRPQTAASLDDLVLVICNETGAELRRISGSDCIDLDQDVTMIITVEATVKPPDPGLTVKGRGASAPKIVPPVVGETPSDQA